jgi:hypothetical protein
MRWKDKNVKKRRWREWKRRNKGPYIILMYNTMVYKGIFLKAQYFIQ